MNKVTVPSRHAATLRVLIGPGGTDQYPGRVHFDETNDFAETNDFFGGYFARCWGRSSQKDPPGEPGLLFQSTAGTVINAPKSSTSTAQVPLGLLTQYK